MADNKNEKQSLRTLHREPDEAHSEESTTQPLVDGTELQDEPENLMSQESGDQDVLEQDDHVLPEEIHPDTDFDDEDGVHGAGHEIENPDTLPEATPGAAPVQEDAATTKRWYIIHAYSGFEQIGRASCRERV